MAEPLSDEELAEVRAMLEERRQLREAWSGESGASDLDAPA